jgi:hypothetical protein
MGPGGPGGPGSRITLHETISGKDPERVAQVKKGIGLLVFLMFAGAVLGAVLTVIFDAFVPSGPIARLFLSHVSIGSASPVTLHLVLLDLSLGLNFHINLLTILGIFLGYYIYRNS